MQQCLGQCRKQLSLHPDFMIKKITIFHNQLHVDYVSIWAEELATLRIGGDIIYSNYFKKFIITIWITNYL